MFSPVAFKSLIEVVLGIEVEVVVLVHGNVKAADFHDNAVVNRAFILEAAAGRCGKANTDTKQDSSKFSVEF